MYEACCDNVVYSLFGGPTLAIRGGRETPFVHGRMKMPHTSPQAIEFNTSCSGQAHSKGPSAGPGNKNTEYGCAFGVLHLPFIICPVSRKDAWFK